MSAKMYTEKEYLEGIRGATGERAVWFYLLMKESEKLGVNPDDICKEAIYGFGKMRGQKYSVAGTPGKMAEMLYNSKGQKVFEMELVKNTDENGVLKFHRCPLDDAWKEYGLTKEERKEICRLACYGDYGRVDCAQGVRLEFAQKCAHDDEVCELVFTKK
ncbi:L-2-amino-thiazoline-4-carboxylic acid hydrolase [Clostridioides difficile]